MTIVEIDPSILAPRDLQSAPWSPAYVPFSHFIPAITLSSLASSLTTTPNTRLALLRDQLKPEAGEPPLGQVEWLFDTANYSPFFQSPPDGEDRKYGTLMQMLQHPFSSGTIHIRPAHDGQPPTSSDHPAIDAGFYRGPNGAIDLKLMSAAQKFATKICATPPLSDIILSRAFPPPPMQEPGMDDEDFEDWVRETTVSDWHPVGTCAMGGSQGREAGVVDERLRVYGVGGLRVVDASVFPTHISGHPQVSI